MSRNGYNGENGEKSPASDGLSWMPKLSGPLETGDFGEIGDFDENRQRACDIQNLANIQIGCKKWPLQII